MAKIYVGNGKEIFFQDGGSLISVGINVDKLVREAQNHGFDTRKGERYINLKVCKNRDGEDTYGNTHYVEVDTWKPESQRSSGQSASPSYGSPPPQPTGPGPGSVSGGGSFEDDIPF